MTKNYKQRVLLVCLGNICRSPLAEVIMRQHAERMGLHHTFEFASAGTGDWHIGGPADRRSAETALRHDLSLAQHKAQQITAHTIKNWDWFVAMDNNNKHDLLQMGIAEKKLLLMRQFEKSGKIADIPDPYYGGKDGFESVYHLLQKNMQALLSHLSGSVEQRIENK